MILQAARIASASGHAATADHVFAGGANEAIHVLQGCRADLEDMVLDAAAAGKKYAFRHYKLSAYEDTTREQALELAVAVAEEFGFDLGRCVLIEHEKERVGGEACGRHWHLIAPEWDPGGGQRRYCRLYGPAPGRHTVGRRSDNWCIGAPWVSLEGTETGAS